MITWNGPGRPRFPRALVHPLGPLFRHLPLNLRRHLLYLRAHGRWGNFNTPSLRNEKTQWRILNDRRALIGFTCDKLATRAYVERLPSVNHPGIKLPEILWVGTDIRELESLADRLPTHWVLKPNHSSGRMALINSAQAPLDWRRLAALGEAWLQPDEEVQVFGHWAYSLARPLLIAQARMDPESDRPADLRIFCNAGRIVATYWTRGLHTDEFALAAYGSDLKTRETFGRSNEISLTERSPVDALSDEARRAIIAFSEEVAAPFDSVRIDGILANGTFAFLELTTYETSGLGPISPEMNARWSRGWQLPDLSTPDPREAEWRALLEGTPRGTLQRT